MTQTKIDVRGQTCPVPLVECRKAIRKAAQGDELIISGTHPASKKEIPMACEAMGIEIIEVKGEDKDWEIRIKR